MWCDFLARYWWFGANESETNIFKWLSDGAVAFHDRTKIECGYYMSAGWDYSGVSRGLALYNGIISQLVYKVQKSLSTSYICELRGFSITSFKLSFPIPWNQVIFFLILPIVIPWLSIWNKHTRLIPEESKLDSLQQKTEYNPKGQLIVTRDIGRFCDPFCGHECDPLLDNKTRKCNLYFNIKVFH